MLFTSMQTDHCIIVVIVRMFDVDSLSHSLCYGGIVVSDDFVASSSLWTRRLPLIRLNKKQFLIVIFLCQHAVFRLLFCLFIHSD